MTTKNSNSPAEKIKNTIEDNGKIVVRISNKMIFAYLFSEDAYSIDNDDNNFRYATKEEAIIYNSNKKPEDRFYSLNNAPELRHEVLKERVAALHKVYKNISEDSMYKLVTCDMSRQYWEHELSESKDKEIEALKKQVKSLIEYKDSLTKSLLLAEKSLKNSEIKYDSIFKQLQLIDKLNEWVSVEKQKPSATEAGNWDGLRSEQILVQDKDGAYYVAVMYEGTLDGSYFCNFYSKPNDFEIENVINWKHIN